MKWGEVLRLSGRREFKYLIVLDKVCDRGMAFRLVWALLLWVYLPSLLSFVHVKVLISH